MLKRISIKIMLLSIVIALTLINCNKRTSPIIIGHRGAMGHVTENTLESLQKAMDLDVDGIEIDIFKCKSGELVVFHDKNLSRLTDSNGLIESLDLDSIKKIFGLTVDEIEFSKLEDIDSIDKYSLVRWLSREPAPEWIYKYNFSLDTNHIVQNSQREIFSWVREQSISITNHRYGNKGISPVSI